MMKIVRYSSENVPIPTKKDWDRLESVKEDEIDFSDCPELTEEQLAQMKPSHYRNMVNNKPIIKTVNVHYNVDIYMQHAIKKAAIF